jgi:hypothetical protein
MYLSESEAHQVLTDYVATCLHDEAARRAMMEKWRIGRPYADAVDLRFCDYEYAIAEGHSDDELERCRHRLIVAYRKFILSLTGQAFYRPYGGRA